MKTNKTLLAIALGAGLFSATTAHAALTSALGGQGVYDSDLNITWLADANLAASNTFGVIGVNPQGRMSWNVAQSWIAAMNGANYLGFNDWRLPTSLQPDANCSDQWGGWSSYTNCTGSEMGHLFYNELGGGAGQSITTTHNANFGLFQNIQAGSGSEPYWSGTEFAEDTNYAWYFFMFGGYQDLAYKPFTLHAMAVRSGQSTAVTSVPEPEIYAMLLAGLGLMGFTARRRVRS